MCIFSCNRQSAKVLYFATLWRLFPLCHQHLLQSVASSWTNSSVNLTGKKSKRGANDNLWHTLLLISLSWFYWLTIVLSSQRDLLNQQWKRSPPRREITGNRLGEIEMKKVNKAKKANEIRISLPANVPITLHIEINQPKDQTPTEKKSSLISSRTLQKLMIPVAMFIINLIIKWLPQHGI